MDSEHITFHMEFRPVFLFIYIVGTIGNILFLLSWVAFEDMNLQPHVILESIGYIIVYFSPAFSVSCGLFMRLYFRYFVSPEGIGGQTAMGRSRIVKWENIADVRPIRIGNLTYARLITRDNQLPVWLPMFLKDVDRFDLTIERHAPSGNPARILLKEA